MTATETPSSFPGANAAEALANSSSPRRLLIFGTGFGVALTGKNLEAVVVRSRWSGPRLVRATTIRDFRARPAAEWGAELSRFLASAREKHRAATVLLPRDETIVRTVVLAGVAEKDAQGAIELQIDTLHPFGDEEVAWAFQPVGGGQYAVGIARRAVLESYETLFNEAGIPVAAFSFSASVIHAALRIWSAPPAALLVVCGADARTEIYGESAARRFYSAEYPVPLERALALARGELRLTAQQGAQSLEEALPRAKGEQQGFSALAYAAALAGSARLATRFANLLPKERRASSARRQYLLPAILGMLLCAGIAAVFVVMPAMEQRNYLAALNGEIRRLEPAAQRVQAMEKLATVERGRMGALDEIRRRPQADLDVLNELTRLLPAQVWTSSIEIYPDSVVLAGEADQAAPLLKLLDSSPLFQNSEFAISMTRNAQNEQFRIKTMRRGRTGKTTP